MMALSLQQFMNREPVNEKAPWDPRNKKEAEFQRAQGDAASHAAGYVLNKNVADIRNMNDVATKKLRATAAQHKSAAASPFAKYKQLGGTKSMGQLAYPTTPRKEWEKTNRAAYEKQHPKAKDPFGDRYKKIREDVNAIDIENDIDSRTDLVNFIVSNFFRFINNPNMVDDRALLMLIAALSAVSASGDDRAMQLAKRLAQGAMNRAGKLKREKK